MQNWFAILGAYANGQFGAAPTDPPVKDDNGNTLDPWAFYFPMDVELTLKESVKADNPIGIYFSGPAQAAINITSDTPVILAGNIANSLGDTTIIAPSITQEPSATIATNNLTLSATGGVGTAAQPLDASLTANGVLNVSAGSQGAYLNLGSGALLGTLSAGKASTGYGDVVLTATDSLAVEPGPSNGTVNVTGNNITLTSTGGAVGTAAAPLLIQAYGIVNVSALSDIGLNQQSGALQVGQIVSTTGDVTLNVPSGSIVNDSGTTWASEVDNAASQQVWTNLGLTTSSTSSSSPAQQTITAFENEVNADYVAYWQLLDNGSVVNGVFALSSTGVTNYTSQAALALGETLTGTLTTGSNQVAAVSSTTGLFVGQAISGNGIAPGTTVQSIDTSTNTVTLSANATVSGSESVIAEATPTDAQVQTFANDQYQSYVTFFNQNLAANWMSEPEFQANDSSFSYVATSQQVSNLESNATWTTAELMNPVAQVALDPAAGTPVGILTPNISGAKRDAGDGRKHRPYQHGGDGHLAGGRSVLEPARRLRESAILQTRRPRTTWSSRPPGQASRSRRTRRSSSRPPGDVNSDRNGVGHHSGQRPRT